MCDRSSQAATGGKAFILHNQRLEPNRLGHIDHMQNDLFKRLIRSTDWNHL
jgi:hypothetical protein